MSGVLFDSITGAFPAVARALADPDSFSISGCSELSELYRPLAVQLLISWALDLLNHSVVYRDGAPMRIYFSVPELQRSLHL